MNTHLLIPRFRKLMLSVMLAFTVLGLQAQSVYDIIADSDDHNSLQAAIETAGLDGVLDDPMATFTVFAPTDAAFDAAVAALGIDIPTLLASPDLNNILLYHVLDSEVMSGDVTNGLTALPLNTANSIKFSVTTDNMVFANQAMVNAADLDASNGVVHSLDAVILDSQTVADVALGSADHTSLVAAVVEARLLPALTDPFASLTVFAPDNAAFDSAVTALGIDIPALLASPDLTDILLYHVLGSEVMSGDLMNGMLANPLNTNNTIKVTVTDDNMVFANQAMVNAADLGADNGVVHSLAAVIFDSQTVADVALGSANHTSLVAAVIEAELLPALTDPFASLTVFAPTNQSFDNLASALSTDIAGILALPDLADILLYHVIGSELLELDLSDGNLETLSGEDVIVDVSVGTMINASTVITANLTADNGVVHVLDAVLLATYLSVEENAFDNASITVYPNPTSDYVMIQSNGTDFDQIIIRDNLGKEVFQQNVQSNETMLDLRNLSTGQYIVSLVGNENFISKRLIINAVK